MHITDLEHEHSDHCWWNWTEECWVCPERVSAQADPIPARPDLPEAVVAAPDPAEPRVG
jgi:hypothetical protein